MNVDMIGRNSQNFNDDSFRFSYQSMTKLAKLCPFCFSSKRILVSLKETEYLTDFNALDYTVDRGIMSNSKRNAKDAPFLSTPLPSTPL
jgi:protease II